MYTFEKIREVRVELGLTQADFASLMGVSQNNVSKFESGRTKFIPKSYIDFLVEKGYDINTLFDDEVPLKKLGDRNILMGESLDLYRVRNDDPLINTIKRSLGIESTSHLNELFSRFDENSNSTINFFELLILNTWEKNYLAEMRQMERRISELERSLSRQDKKNP